MPESWESGATGHAATSQRRNIRTCLCVDKDDLVDCLKQVCAGKSGPSVRPLRRLLREAQLSPCGSWHCSDNITRVQSRNPSSRQLHQLEPRPAMPSIASPLLRVVVRASLRSAATPLAWTCPRCRTPTARWNSSDSSPRAVAKPYYVTTPIFYVNACTNPVPSPHASALLTG